MIDRLHRVGRRAGLFASLLAALQVGLVPAAAAGTSGKGSGSAPPSDNAAPGEGVGSLPILLDKSLPGLLLVGSPAQVHQALHGVSGRPRIEILVLDPSDPASDLAASVQGDFQLSFARSLLVDSGLDVFLSMGSVFGPGVAKASIGTHAIGPILLQPMDTLGLPLAPLFDPGIRAPASLALSAFGPEHGLTYALTAEARGDFLILTQLLR